jgi:hypothetical protein
VIFLLLGLQAALVKMVALVMVQLELLQVGLGLGWVQNRYQAALLTGVHSVLQPYLYSSDLAVLLAPEVSR